MKTETLRIRQISNKTLWLTLFILLILIGISEMFVRMGVFQAPLTPPQMGSRHYQLGHKLALLDTDIMAKGSIDCIMVGSSMVDVGFNPAAFQSAYREIIGEDIRCFNFGIDASSAFSSAALVRILIEDYHPSLLILGTDPRDYAIPSTDRDPSVVLATPWVKYRHGDFSLEGWLQDHSYLYRYRQHLGRLIRFQFKDTLWSETQLNYPILPNGYTPITKTSPYINTPPKPDDTSYEVTYYRNIYTSYQVLDENLSALETIMDYNGLGTQVIAVEMPVSDGLYYFFGNGEADYDKFVARVSELANLHKVPFWRTEPLDAIPDDGWSDYSHLNVIGAEIFSSWLGEQVGEAEMRGSIEIFNP